MPKFRFTLVALCLSALLAAPASAQLGAFIDWINKMSGPELHTFSATYRIGYNPGQTIDFDDVQMMQSSLAFFGRLPGEEAGRARVCLQNAVNAAPALFASQIDGGRAFGEVAVDRAREYIEDVYSILAFWAAPAGQEAAAPGREQRLRLAACNLENALEALPVDRGHGLRLRLKGLYGYDRGNADRQENDIRVWAFQPTLEYVFGVPLWDRRLFFGIESGAGYWAFTNDGDNVQAFSIPVFVNFHPFARCSSWLLRNFNIGGGVQLFEPIDETEFNAGFVDEEGWEVVWAFKVGVDLSRSSLESAPRLRCGP